MIRRICVRRSFPRVVRAWLAIGAIGVGGTAAPAAGEGPPASAVADGPPRIAAHAPDRAAPPLPASPPAGLADGVSPAPADDDAIAEALRLVAECKARYALVRDYTCTFQKRERVGGRLTAPHVMQMKVRSQPFSIYCKFAQPNKGREAIYVAGRHDGKILAHDVGIGRVLAGTMHLDPKGDMAMEENRHPVTDAGIGNLIDTIQRFWAAEMRAGETRVTIRRDARSGDRPATLIECVHPAKRPGFLFHAVKVYIDHESGLPVRFEAYDWPARPGLAPELVEEYQYHQLKLNVNIKESDFDPTNRGYSFGRF